MVVFKIVQITVEYLLDKTLGEELLQSPCKSLLNLGWGIGALTFFEFLVSYFISVAIQMCDRSYICFFEEFITEYLEHKYNIIKKFILKYNYLLKNIIINLTKNIY